jgi:hypothetical protein
VETKIVITVNPATGAIGLEGPDMLTNRALYDFVFAECQRQLALKFAKAAESRIVTPALRMG